jgi:trehalose-6-phosphate synthase
LILSEFAGAARELADALIINPYDTEQFAEAIRQALEMAPMRNAGSGWGGCYDKSRKIISTVGQPTSWPN